MAGQGPVHAGDERTFVDVAIYAGFILSLAPALALPGDGESLVQTAAIVPAIVLLVLLGLRDKISFLQARSEQYLPALIFFAFFPFVDMIVAAKVLIVIVWLGASISKLGHHFACVIPPMVSNTPWLPSKWVKRLHYRNFPDDLRPSPHAVRFAHVGGTLVEFCTPLVLLFSHNATLTAVAVILMVCFHLFITSTFPLAVPLEWNVLFMYLPVFLFLGFPAQDGYRRRRHGSRVAGDHRGRLLFFPILGNLRPDLVSFLPSMRQYAGNWATAMWAFAPGAEDKLNDRRQVGAAAEASADRHLRRRGGGGGAGPDARLALDAQPGARAELGDDQPAGSRHRHLHAARGGVRLQRHLRLQLRRRPLARRQVRRGDAAALPFEPGEYIVAWVESEAIGSGRQRYWVMDAAVGTVERGSWSVSEAIHTLPHLPDGPINLDVEWRLEGYKRVRHAVAPQPEAVPA